MLYSIFPAEIHRIGATGMLATSPRSGPGQNLPAGFYATAAGSASGLFLVFVKFYAIILTYAANQTGSALVTVRAEDRYGASLEASFLVTVA